MTLIIAARSVPKLLWTILIFLFLPIGTLFGIISSLWRAVLLKFIQKFINPQVTSLVPCRSTAFGLDPLYSHPKCCLLLSFQLDGTWDLDSFKNLLEERLVKAKLPNGLLKYPEPSQHIQSYFGYLFWQKNSWEFNLDEVVIPIDYTNDEDLHELKLRLLRSPFVKNKPLYSLYFMRRFKNDENKMLLLLRVHHVLGDGYSFLYLWLVQLLQSELPGMIGTSLTLEEEQSDWLDKVKFLIQLPFRFSDELASCLQLSFKKMHFMVPEKRQSGLFHMMECESVSVAEVKAFKKALNVGFTSVLIAVVSSVLREVLVLRGCSIEENEELPCILPIPIPVEYDGLRNYMTASWAKLPIGETCPLQRVLKCEKDMKRMKSSAFPHGMKVMSWVWGSYPNKIAKLMNRNGFAPIGISNLPGKPGTAVSYGGATLSKAFYSAGLQSGITGVVFCIMTSLDHLVVTFSGLAEAVSISEMTYMRTRIPMIFEEYFNSVKSS